MFQGPGFLSVTTVVIPGHGDKPLFPSQVPLSLPLPGPAHCFPVVFSCFQSPSILVTGLSAFCTSLSLSAHCCGECCTLRGTCLRVLVCKAWHITFLLGVLGPVDPFNTQYLRTGLGMLKHPASKLEPDSELGQSVCR